MDVEDPKQIQKHSFYPSILSGIFEAGVKGSQVNPSHSYREAEQPCRPKTFGFYFERDRLIHVEGAC